MRSAEDNKYCLLLSHFYICKVSHDNVCHCSVLELDLFDQNIRTSYHNKVGLKFRTYKRKTYFISQKWLTTNNPIHDNATETM